MSWIPQHIDESHILSGNEFSEIAYELVGEEVQRLSVVNSLPTLLQGSDGPLCMQRVVPKVLLALDKASKEFHIAAALTFYTILEKKLVHPKTYCETFLRSMVENIDFKVPEVAAIWLNVLLDAIALLPVDAIRAEVLPIAINKGQISQPVSSRIKSCRLLGKASLRLEQFYLKKEILPVILSLCQDVNHEVRACICAELSNIVKALDADVSKTMLLPSLVELASDEEALVRISSVSTIVEVVDHLTSDVIKNTIMPLVKKLCVLAKGAEDDVLVSISFQIGKLCSELQNYMTAGEKQWLLGYYEDAAQLGMVTKDTRKNFPIPDFSMSGNADRLILCRQNCAYNFPAVAVFCMNFGEQHFEQLYATFSALAGDPYFMVRRTIACGFHEVTSVLGPSCGRVKKELIRLLKDDVEEVLQGLIPNLSKTMVLLAKFGEMGPETMETQCIEIGRAILKCESEIYETHNWRLHSTLMGQMECLPHCLSSEYLNNFFIPIIFARIHKSRALPCRLAAARTLLVFLRYNPKAPQRTDLRARIINELCHGKSCFSRMAFAKLCGSAMDIFSRYYFKEHFYMQLLELHEDKVANVRMQVAGHLPRLKAMLRLPADKKMLVSLETLARRMAANETDRDVRAILLASIDKMDRMTVRDDTSSTPKSMTKEDLEDQRKVEEENRVASVKTDGVRKKNLEVPTSKVSPVTQAAAGIKKASGRGTDTRMTAQVGRGKGPSQSGGFVRTSTIASLEDEFYVDAGIRIPQQLAASDDLGTFPSRIPNLREILFKNRNINGLSGCSNSQYITAVTTTPKTSVIVTSDTLEEAQFSVTSSSASTSGLLSLSSLPSSVFNSNKTVTSEPKLRIKQNMSSGIVERSSTVKSIGQPSNLVQKGSLIGGTIRQNADTYLCNKVDPSRSSSSKGKMGTFEQKQKDVATVVNRRHSYMDGEKTLKTSVLVNKTDNPSMRRSGTSSGNRRHSYIEKVTVDEGKNSKSAFVVKRNYLGTTNAARHSHMEMEQSIGSCKLKSDVTLRKTAIPSRRTDNENRNSEVSNKRRSLIYMPQQLNTRGTSFERRCEFEANPGVQDRQSSHILKHPHSLAVESKRRHSSLERDDLEKLRTPYEQSHKSSDVHVRSLRSSLECINSPKSLDLEKKTQVGYIVNTSNVDKTNLKKDGKLHEDKLGYSTSDENLDIMLRKRNRLSLSKIPRGPTSCHSSPGGSRASSPTNSLSNGIIRTRQRTAPNSRSTSPTGGISSSGNIRRTQRLSLGSLNSYMSNLKLNESSSRLPIRKPPP